MFRDDRSGVVSSAILIFVVIHASDRSAACADGDRKNEKVVSRQRVVSLRIGPPRRAEAKYRTGPFSMVAVLAIRDLSKCHASAWDEAFGSRASNPL
jgi:hypothetical protein